MGAIKFIIFILFVSIHFGFTQFTTPVAVQKLSPREAEDLQQCQDMREKYAIEPGQSFGTLPVSMHNKYLYLRCYRFFCKPHPLAGKGKFPCEPLV